MLLTKPQGKEKLINLFLWASAFFTVFMLILIISYVLVKGVVHVDLQFLTDKPRRMGAEGGIFPVIIGTLYFVTLTIIIATPIGVRSRHIFKRIYPENRLTKIIRFGTELLAGIPSIIFGLFGYLFFVVFLGDITGGWSLVSGALTATCMILPTIIRTSEGKP